MIEPLPLPDFDLEDWHGKVAHWLREASKHYGADITLATKIWTRREKEQHRRKEKDAALRKTAAERKPRRRATTQRKPSVLDAANAQMRKLAGVRT